jgi:hypothetical protein
MNGAQIHLLLNHLPILGLFFALPLLAIVLIKHDAKGVFYSAVIILVIAGIGGVGAMLSGEEAEGVLQQFGGIDHEIMHEHEEMGELAGWVSLAVGLLALAFAFLLHRSGKTEIDVWKPVVLILATGIAASVLAWTGHTGGKIRHPEIREGFDPSAAAPAESSSVGGDQSTENEEEDEIHDH